MQCRYCKYMNELKNINVEKIKKYILKNESTM